MTALRLVETAYPPNERTRDAVNSVCPRSTLSGCDSRSIALKEAVYTAVREAVKIDDSTRMGCGAGIKTLIKRHNVPLFRRSSGCRCPKTNDQLIGLRLSS